MTDLVQQRSRKAVHWLRKTTMETALYGPMETNTVACGQPLDPSGWTSRVATEPHLVTCRSCWPLANPPKSVYQP